MRLPVLAVLLAALPVLPAGADALLQKAKAPPAKGPLYIFDVDYKDADNTFRMTVDPTQPEGKRVTSFSPDPKTLKGDAAKRAKNLIEKTEGNVLCSEFAGNIPVNAKRAAETDQTATYTFTPLPGEEDGDMAKAYKYLNGKAVIDKATGAILSFEMVSPKAFKPMAVAKVDTFNFKAVCKAGPDGRTHIDTFRFDMSGSAMMQAFSQSETRKISNLRQLPDSGFGTP